MKTKHIKTLIHYNCYLIVICEGSVAFSLLKARSFSGATRIHFTELNNNYGTIAINYGVSNLLKKEIREKSCARECRILF